MRTIDFTRDAASPIERYASVRAASLLIGTGTGAARVHVVHFEAGGAIGEHEAGADQLFLVVAGAGWAAGAGGERVPLRAGQGAVFARGERHSKGSATGMTAILIQLDSLALAAGDADSDSDRPVPSP